MKRYAVLLETDISITNVETVINYRDQGWVGRLDGIHSGMLVIEKWVEIEIEGEAGVKAYMEALNAITVDIRARDFYELHEGETID